MFGGSADVVVINIPVQITLYAGVFISLKESRALRGGTAQQRSLAGVLSL